MLEDRWGGTQACYDSRAVIHGCRSIHGVGGYVVDTVWLSIAGALIGTVVPMVAT